MMLSSGHPVVLAYHGVDRVDPINDPDKLIVSPDRLRAHIGTLKKMGFGFSTMAAALTHGSERKRRTVVLTFDDGWANWLEHALPILLAADVPASFYVCPEWWDRPEHPEFAGPSGKLLDAEGVLALHAAGMEVGAHSMTHPDLRKVDDDRLLWEVTASKSAIEDLTGASCRTFAYPYGLYDDRVMDAARVAGFEGALDWLPGPWRTMAVPRLPGPPHGGGVKLALKLLGLRRRGR